jgi:hypothetical protein
MSFITRAFGATKLLLKANAPTIMVTSGVVSMGAGTVLACKQTLKIEEVLEKHVTDLDKIKAGTELDLASYDSNDARSDRIKVYTRVGMDLTKLYAVPAVLFGAGAGLVFGGHRIMIKRNATLALAFTGLKQSFDAYRARVVKHFGSEVDQGMMSGHTLKEVVDPETGQSQLIHARDWDGAGNEPYNRVFEQGATNSWEPDLGVNKMFIAQQQKYAQIKLLQQGHLYLSDVYKSLGFPESDISRVVGWKVKTLPDGSRDIPLVDYGLDKPHPDDWKYNKEHAVYLDFNCQGLIVGGKLQQLLENS